MNQDNNDLLSGDNLLNQIVNISKAAAYDVVVENGKVLREENNQLKTELESARGDNDYLLRNINKMSEANQRLSTLNEVLVDALQKIVTHKGDAEQGLNTYINELNDIAKAALQQVTQK